MSWMASSGMSRRQIAPSTMRSASSARARSRIPVSRIAARTRRLIPEEAIQLIAQLPSKLRADLAECIDGPDKRITRHTIEVELMREIELDEASAGDVLEALCAAVADAISAGEIEDVRAELPRAMKDLFPTFPRRRAG